MASGRCAIRFTDFGANDTADLEFDRLLVGFLCHKPSNRSLTGRKQVRRHFVKLIGSKGLIVYDLPVVLCTPKMLVGLV